MRRLITTAFALSMLAAVLAASPATRQESGTLVNRLNRMLVVMDDDRKTMRNYEVPDGVPVMLNSKPAKLDDLHPGDRVDISLGDEQRVVAVDVRSGRLKAIAVSLALP